MTLQDLGGDKSCIIMKVRIQKKRSIEYKNNGLEEVLR